MKGIIYIYHSILPSLRMSFNIREREKSLSGNWDFFVQQTRARFQMGGAHPVQFGSVYRYLVFDIFLLPMLIACRYFKIFCLLWMLNRCLCKEIYFHSF